MSAMNQHQQNKASLLERLIFNNRPVVIFLCLLVSVFLFYQATQVRPSTSFEKMIPLEHPFIQKMLEHRNDLANLGNTVRISVEAVNGDIFTKEYMETLRQIHDEVFYIPGVDRSGLKSLWSPSVRWTEVTEEGFAGGEVIPQTYDGSPRALEELRNNVLKSGQIGRLVANNFKSSIVDVPLLEMSPNPKNQSELIKLDYRQFSHELEEKIRDKYQLQNPNVKVHIVGFAKKVGDLIDGLVMVVSFFGICLLITLVLLYWFTKCIRSTIAVLITTLVAVLWQLACSTWSVSASILFDAGAVPDLRHRYFPRRAEDQWHRLAVQRRRQCADGGAADLPPTVPAGDDRDPRRRRRLHHPAGDRHQGDPRAGHRRLDRRGGDRLHQPDPAARGDLPHRHQQEGGAAQQG